MFHTTRQVLQAIIGNGYEVRAERELESKGTMVWLISQTHDEEVFYYFTDDNEHEVVDTMARQYCTSTQLFEIFQELGFSASPRQMVMPQFKLA